MTVLRQWYLVQSIVRHFWTRWSNEYLINLRRLTKRQHPTQNISEGDVVVLQEDGLVPSKWQLARVIQVHPYSDGTVRVVTVKTCQGTYMRLVAKLALLLPTEH